MDIKNLGKKESLKEDYFPRPPPPNPEQNLVIFIGKEDFPPKMTFYRNRKYIERITYIAFRNYPNIRQALILANNKSLAGYITIFIRTKFSKKIIYIYLEPNLNTTTGNNSLFIHIYTYTIQAKINLKKKFKQKLINKIKLFIPLQKDDTTKLMVQKPNFHPFPPTCITKIRWEVLFFVSLRFLLF